MQSIQHTTYASQKSRFPRFYFILALCLLGLPAAASEAKHQHDSSPADFAHKQLIGPTTTVEETESNFDFPARVDTGATTSSLHVEEWVIEDEAAEMANNIGKTIRIRLQNDRGESEWIRRKIIEISSIKTSEQTEQRYKVRMKLRCSDVEKRVLVSLNDRSHMNYPVLLGRNFLHDDFLVDVALKSAADQNSRKNKR